MNGVNKAILIGNLGKDPEIRNLDNGVKLARFSLATTETFRDKDGNKTDQTEWHTIVMWRGLAEVAEKYLKKGNSIYVEGRIRTRQWQDEHGNTRYTTEIQADNMTMLGGGRREVENNQQVNMATSQVNEDVPNVDEGQDDDLPF